MFDMFSLKTATARTAGLKGQEALANQHKQGTSAAFGHAGSVAGHLVALFDVGNVSIFRD